MLKKLFFLIFMMMSPGFSAVALKESDLSFLYKQLEEKSFYTVGSFPGANGRALSYARFGKGTGKNGSVVFVNGKAENTLKYMELFYDLFMRGWSPVYSYDHRGQGFSRQASPDSETADYSLYRKDLSAFVQFVLSDPEVDSLRLFLIAHSMGGTVALDYLQTHPETASFKAVALSAPMIKIQSNMPFFIEKPALFLLREGCSFMSCGWRVPSLRKSFTQEFLTNSKARYSFSQYLTTKAFPEARSEGVSFRWVVESFKVTNRIMRESEKIRIPVLIFQSKHEFFVSNKYQDLFCDLIPRCCRIRKMGGKHEIFMEKDQLRDKALEETINFFLNSERNTKECKAQYTK